MTLIFACQYYVNPVYLSNDISNETKDHLADADRWLIQKLKSRHMLNNSA